MPSALACGAWLLFMLVAVRQGPCCFHYATVGNGNKKPHYCIIVKPMPLRVTIMVAGDGGIRNFESRAVENVN
jgi:hypothetical protein